VTPKGQSSHVKGKWFMEQASGYRKPKKTTHG
jgi:hypothetical protein